MPFINEPLGDVREPEAAPEGEYDLRIVKAEQKDSKKGRPMVVATIVIEEPGINAPPFQHFVLAWTDEDDDDQVRNRKLDFKRFCAAFDVGEDFDAPELVGRTTRCHLTQETGDDNVVRNRLRLPKLRD